MRRDRRFIPKLLAKLQCTGWALPGRQALEEGSWLTSACQALPAGRPGPPPDSVSARERGGQGRGQGGLGQVGQVVDGLLAGLFVYLLSFPLGFPYLAFLAWSAGRGRGREGGWEAGRGSLQAPLLCPSG